MNIDLTQGILYTLPKSIFNYTDRLISIFICLLSGKQRYWFAPADILLKLNLPKFSSSSLLSFVIRLSETSMEL